MSRRPRIAPIILALAVGISAADIAPATPNAVSTQVFDRTLLCSTLAIGGGLHQFEIKARAGIRQDRTTWKSLAFVAARSGHVAIGPAMLDDAIAWAGAGRVSHATTLEESRIPYPAQTYGTLAVNQQLCRPSNARVPLTPKGLDGGPAGPLGEEYDCPAPSRVLVRLRATLATRTPVYRDRHLLKTKATLRTASLAIRTRTGKPLAFAAVFESGSARLFTAPGCLAD